MGVSTMKMSDDEVRSIAHHICNLNESRVEMISMEFDHSAE